MQRFLRNPYNLVIAGAACVIALLSGIAWADSSPTPASMTVAASGRTLPSLVRDNFAVFESVSSRATPPAGIHATLRTLTSPQDPSNQRQGLEVTRTVQVDTGSDGMVWVVPGQSGMCALTTDTTANGTDVFDGQTLEIDLVACRPTAVVLEHGIVSTSPRQDGSALVYGLVPNGNTTVTAIYSSGATSSVPVTDNIFRAALPQTPISILLQNSNRKEIRVQIRRRPRQATRSSY